MGIFSFSSPCYIVHLHFQRTELLSIFLSGHDSCGENALRLYKLDKTHASLTWRVKHLGLSNYTARFTQFDADLKWMSKVPQTLI